MNSSKKYLQEPKRKIVDHQEYKLEQVLIHTKTGNEYQIKEIQDKGFIALLIKTLGKPTSVQSYISNTALNEYR